MSLKPTRHVDPQGRILIPSHIRKELNLSPGSAVTIELGRDRTIKVSAAKDCCFICGKTVGGSDATKVKAVAGEKVICPACAERVSQAKK